MKITMNDIAKIEHAEVMIQGISVLTGYNATGKSTVSKALNAIISAYADNLQRAEYSRHQSMRTALNGFMNKILADRPYFILGDNLRLFLQEAQTKESRFPEDYEKFRELAARLDDNEELPEATSEINVEYRSFLEKSRTIQERPIGDYIRFVIERSILSAFDNQINTIGQTSLGRIVLSSNNGDMNCEVFFKGNRLQSCSYKRIKVPKPIYLKSKHSLDDLPTDGKLDSIPRK